MKKFYLDNIEDQTEDNETFRTVLYTGEHLQLTVMSIVVSGEIGAEVHPSTDQFLRAEDGKGEVYMGDSEETMKSVGQLKEDMAVIVPAGTWHNIKNVGDKPLKVYSIYAPPNHPEGTVHQTKADADAAEAAEHSK